MRAFQPFAWLLTVCAALLLSACGSSSSSNEEPNTVLIGKVTTTAVMAVSAKNHGPLSACVVEAPEICSPVAADGTFTLRGLPEGSFSLQFFHGTPPVALGAPIVFEEVAPNQQITIEVELAGEEVLLVDEDRRGIGHAGVELQGPEDDEGDDGDGDKKITICHLPGGDFNKRKTISISESAWKAHQKHGDTEGACAP